MYKCIFNVINNLQKKKKKDFQKQAHSDYLKSK